MSSYQKETTKHLSNGINDITRASCAIIGSGGFAFGGDYVYMSGNGYDFGYTTHAVNYGHGNGHGGGRCCPSEMLYKPPEATLYGCHD